MNLGEQDDMGDVIGRLEGSVALFSDQDKVCVVRNLYENLKVQYRESCLDAVFLDQTSRWHINNAWVWVQSASASLDVPLSVLYMLLSYFSTQDPSMSRFLSEVKSSANPGLWHCEDAADNYGYCYLSMIREVHKAYVADKLGPYPNFLQLLTLDWDVYVDVEQLHEIVLVTDDMDGEMLSLKAVTAYDCLRFVACRPMPYMPTTSAYSFLNSTVVPVNTAGVTVMPYDTLGGKTWHVTTATGDYNEPDGFCYVHMLQFKHRRVMTKVIGAYPTVQRLLTMQKSIFRPTHNLQRVFFLQHGKPLPDAFVAMDVLTFVAHSLPLFQPGTLGEAIQTRVKPKDFSSEGAPRGMDLVGAATAVLPEQCNVYRSKALPYVPPLSEVESEHAFTEFLQSEALPTEESFKEEMLTSMAGVLVNGSADVVFLNASVQFFGRCIPLSGFLTVLRRRFPYRNSLRLWVRSFRKGEMCLRISGLLSSEQNVALRMLAASKYGADDCCVHLCFDTVRTFAKLTALKYTERIFVRVSKYLKFGDTSRDCELHRVLRS